MPQLVFPHELDFDSPVEEMPAPASINLSLNDAAAMNGNEDSLAPLSKDDSGEPMDDSANNSKNNNESQEPASDEMQGRRITQDMTDEEKNAIMEYRMERKRKHSREWHAKFTAKGVPCLIYSQFHSIYFVFNNHPQSKSPKTPHVSTSKVLRGKEDDVVDDQDPAPKAKASLSSSKDPQGLVCSVFSMCSMYIVYMCNKKSTHKHVESWFEWFGQKLIRHPKLQAL